MLFTCVFVTLGDRLKKNGCLTLQNLSGPHRGGLPGQPRRVTRLAGVSFLHVNAGGGVG